MKSETSPRSEHRVSTRRSEGLRDPGRGGGGCTERATVTFTLDTWHLRSHGTQV